MHSAINHRPSDEGVKHGYRSKKYGYKGVRGHQGGGNIKRFRDPEMVIIRNKYTKQVVDLEVRIYSICHALSL